MSTMKIHKTTLHVYWSNVLTERFFIPYKGGGTVKVQIFFLSTKDIKANELVTIMLNLMKVRLFCLEDNYFTCNLGKKSRS